MASWRAALRGPRRLYERTRQQYDRAWDLARGMSVDLAASTEVRQATLRTLLTIDDRLRGAEAVIAERFDEALREQPDLVDEAMHRLVGAPADALTPGVADLLTYEHGPEGFQARAGLWINSPLWIMYAPGRVFLHDVNERVVEVPYALAAAQRLAPGSSIVDVGASDSTTALSLACLGYAVTALDVRPHALAHPNLTAVQADLLEWEPAQSFDAALCISTIEHVGLGWYGDPVQPDGDREALERVRSWLRPGGTLVLTVPFGDEPAAEHQRSYNRETLAKLVDGWDLEEQRFFVKADDGSWSEHDGSDWPGTGVALVTAHRS